MIQGILFDFDGTLADTSPVIFDCYAYATEKVLGHKAPLQPYLDTFGKPLRPSLVRLFGAGKGNAICDVYRERQDAVHDRLIRPFPGVKETLAALRARHLPVAVVTSKLNKTCRRGLRCVGLEHFFRPGPETKTRPGWRPARLGGPGPCRTGQKGGPRDSAHGRGFPVRHAVRQGSGVRNRRCGIHPRGPERSSVHTSGPLDRIHAGTAAAHRPSGRPAGNRYLKKGGIGICVK